MHVYLEIAILFNLDYYDSVHLIRYFASVCFISISNLAPLGYYTLNFY